MSKKIIARYRNGYGLKWEREFYDAEEYLEWKRKDTELWNKRNDIYLELIEVTTRWLPLDWSDFK